MTCKGCKIGFLEFFSLLSDEERLIKYLRFHKALPVMNYSCPHCQSECSFSRITMFIRCGKRKKVAESDGDGGGAKKSRGVFCNFRRSIRKGTWFDKSPLPFDKILFIAYAWLTLPSPRIKLIKAETGLKKRVITEWFENCREVCYQWALSVCERVGGAGVEVELGEAEVSGRGRMKGAVAGMELATGRCFLVPVEGLGPEALLDVLTDWVHPGSTIVSDCWARYSTARAGPFSRLSMTYVDPGGEGGAATARRTAGQLAELLFKRRYPNHSERLHHFVTVLGTIYYPVEHV